ncbi:3-oxoacyl-ACP reductase FabG [Tissierella sp. MSJ-40]|uniref:3-oxoacyl-ACP reductase FabG n=1 Tax=Tissierella simiarum TaxID=2841534 RepID=A0ABS6EB61_9FIRM|nr:3-oxoacyl-ACP reductase family protein [Tissierella simiarum]MBU5440150.1 3-oxoacyl-ACP reductase FabG [Tissierella simiarum]
MDLKLKDKCAVVTGGSRGVGRGICVALAKEGVNIVINYSRNDKAALEAKEEVEKLGSKAIIVKADIGTPEGCQLLIDEGEKAFGNVDILINNAGVWPKNWIQDIPLDEWNKTIDVNLTSVFLTSQAFLRKNLEKKRPGRILNVTSQAAFNGSTTGHAHYAASKSGVVALTVSMAREVAKYGINVNAIALGIVETDMIKDALDKNKDYYLSRIPVGRVATAEDIANIVTFLVSEPASYITGATIDASGGMLMR